MRKMAKMSALKLAEQAKANQAAQRMNSVNNRSQGAPNSNTRNQPNNVHSRNVIPNQRGRSVVMGVGNTNPGSRVPTNSFSNMNRNR